MNRCQWCNQPVLETDCIKLHSPETGMDYFHWECFWVVGEMLGENSPSEDKPEEKKETD